MNQPKPKRPLSHSYARYSSIAFQMLAIILLGVYAGLKLDSWLACSPWFTAGLSVFSVIVAIYFVIKDLIRKQ